MESDFLLAASSGEIICILSLNLACAIDGSTIRDLALSRSGDLSESESGRLNRRIGSEFKI